MHRIALTVVAPDIEAEVDPRFGRADFILLVEPETMAWEALANPAREAWGGAGIEAAEFVAERRPHAVCSGDFGPNAYEALEAAGITMYRYESCRTAREAVERFKAGELPVAEPPRRGSGRRRGRRWR